MLDAARPLRLAEHAPRGDRPDPDGERCGSCWGVERDPGSTRSGRSSACGTRPPSSHTVHPPARAPAVSRSDHVRSLGPAPRPHHTPWANPAARYQLDQQPRQRSARASSSPYGSTQLPGNRYEYGYVGSSSYWKLKRAAAFELWSIDEHYKALRLVRAGPKVAYCLRDLTRKHPSGRSPGAPVYPACNENPNIRRDVLGTSVGWSDVYPYEYPEQWINVTGLRGRFAYVQIADPGNLLMESSHRNNVSETYLALPSGRVLGHRVGVSAP